MPTTKAKPRTIDEFLAGVNAEQRAALEKLRQTIRAVAPKAEECISYGLAAFRLNGRPLVAFGATANHCFLSDDRLNGGGAPKGTQRLRHQQRHDSLCREQAFASGAGAEVGQGSHCGEPRLKHRNAM